MLSCMGLLVVARPENRRAHPDQGRARAYRQIQIGGHAHRQGIERVATGAQLLAQALQTFYEVRDVAGLKKKPSTSELLDWLKLLLAEDIPPDALRSKDAKTVVPPLHGALLKNEQDVHLFERLVFMSRTNR